jgi:hypothetical protein
LRIRAVPEGWGVNGSSVARLCGSGGFSGADIYIRILVDGSFCSDFFLSTTIMGSLLSSLGKGLLLTVALLIAYSYIQDWRRNPGRLPYPPGPKGYPIIGNLFDIPNAFIYKRFREMSREIGQSILL